METFVLPFSGKKVDVPSTGREWDFHTVDCSHCERPARDMTTALKKALRALDKAAESRFRPCEAMYYDLWAQYLVPVALKYADVGACDTEPRCCAIETMERVVNLVLGRF